MWWLLVMSLTDGGTAAAKELMRHSHIRVEVDGHGVHHALVSTCPHNVEHWTVPRGMPKGGGPHILASGLHPHPAVHG